MKKQIKIMGYDAESLPPVDELLALVMEAEDARWAAWRAKMGIKVGNLIPKFVVYEPWADRRTATEADWR